MMRSYLLFPVALVLLVPIWAAACGVQPTAIPPTDEAVTAQAGQAGNDEGLEIAEEEVDASTPTSAAPTEEANVSPIPTPEATEVEPPDEAKPAVRLAREDLGGRLGLAPEAIRLVSAEAVEWPDASLGCPQPGMMYAQVITPGFQVTLEAEGEKYAYHTDQGEYVVLCQPKEGGDEAKPPAQAEGVIQLAREDLAQKLGLAPEAIRLVSVEAVEWSDASLGCPQPGMMYAQVITPGFLVVLEAGGERYTYHTDEGRFVVLCQEGIEASGDTGQESMPAEPTLPDPGDPFLKEMVSKAREDLARRLSVPVDQIDLLEVREVTWPDASLGCPQPGMMYAQMLQDGLLIRLGLGKDMYFYHSGETGDPFLCEGTSQIVPKVTPKTDEFVPPPDSEID